MRLDILTFVIGFLAQGFFSARVLVQWALSERARRVLSPSLFWILSLLGSYLLCLYGWLRHDFAIVLGQFVSYYVYLWNLEMKGVWGKVPLPIRIVLLATPVVALLFVANHAGEFAATFLRNAEIPLWLLLFGSISQVLFTLRFVYQWWWSRRRGESCLPAGFWYISLVGSLSIVTYGLIRQDVVLIVGQAFGVVAYSRNLVLLRKQMKGVAS